MSKLTEEGRIYNVTGIGTKLNHGDRPLPHYINDAFVSKKEEQDKRFVCWVERIWFGSIYTFFGCMGLILFLNVFKLILLSANSIMKLGN